MNEVKAPQPSIELMALYDEYKTRIALAGQSIDEVNKAYTWFIAATHDAHLLMKEARDG